MSLLKDSEALAEAARSVKAAESLAAQVKAVTARADKLTTVTQDLKSASGRTKALRGRGVVVDVDVRSAPGTRHFVTEWRVAVAKDASAALGTGDQVVQPKIIGPAQRLADALDAASAAAWRAHAHARLPRFTEDVLVLLASLPGQRAAVSAFRERYQRVAMLADSPPKNDGEFARFDQLAASCDKAWKELDGQDLPLAVRRFVREAGSSAGAPLNSLTSEVLQWLTTHRLVDGFRIRPQ